MKTIDQESIAENTLPSDERIDAELIEILFRFVTPAVLASQIFVVMLAFIIHHLGYLDPVSGPCWVGYMIAACSSHIVLSRFYRRSDQPSRGWRRWAAWFTVISLAEGSGWGWASISLATGGGVQVGSLMALAAGGVAAGSIPAFCPYLIALFAVILTTTMPYAVVSFVSDDKVQQAVTPMMLLFIGVLGGLGVLANRTLRQGIRLRIRTEDMTVDLRRQKEIAEKANVAKSSFLAAASHDLRQPVHALSLFVGALHHVPMPSDGKRLVEQIDASTNAMDKLFTALLDISRLDAGVVVVDRRPFAIDPILDRVCCDYAGQAEAKGLALSYVHCNAIVDSDPALVERILRNLVSNAVRYTDHGRVVVGCRPRGSKVAMQVWDTGRGIPPDQCDLVFQEYYQIGNPGRDREKGLGLGLAIVRRLTDLLGCNLILRSQIGRGSCFEVSIARSTCVASPPTLPIDENFSMPSTGMVVVVDDEQAIRIGMSSLLTGWGYEVVAAGSADEAIQILSTRTVRPALLVCDFRLGEANGIEAIEMLRAEYNEHIPAMLITGDTAPNRLLEANSSGFVLLHKPVPNGKLRAVISRLIISGSDGQSTSNIE